METQTRTTAKDFFLHIGSMIALYTTAVNLGSLLFTVINKAYPQINSGSVFGYGYSSYSISFPVASIVIMFPVFLLLMWLLEKSYNADPEKKYLGLKKWLTYITLFFSGLVIAGDLITLLYYFIDGQELTTGFILKVLVVLAISVGVFIYFITDVRDRLTHSSRLTWRIGSCVVVVGAIILGFSIIGSPYNQRLSKYDEQKVTDLQNIDNSVTSFYSTKGTLPKNIDELVNGNYYVTQVDSQNQKPYEYTKTSATTYNLCAEFNKASPDAPAPNVFMRPIGYQSWIHPAGHYCFEQTINPNTYLKPSPVY